MPVVLVLVVMTYFSYSKARVTLSDTIDKQLGNMVKIQGEALFSNLMVYRAITQEVSQDNVILNYVDAYANGDRERLNYYTPITQERLARLVDSFSGINDVVVLNSKGVAIAATLDANLGKDFSRTDFVQGAMKGGESHRIIQTGKKVDFAICYPVLAKDKSIMGFVFLVLNLDHIAKRSIDNVNFSATGTAVVFNDQGIIVMHKNRDIVGENRSNTEEFQKVSSVKTGIVQYEYQDKLRVAYVYEIKWLNWYMSFPVWEEDIFAGVYELYSNTLLICAVSLLILLVIIAVFSKNIASALGGIDKISSKVAGGDMNLTEQENGMLKNLAKRSDEIGGLSDSFGKMIVALLDTIQEAKNAYKVGMNEAAEKLQDVVSATSAATHQLSAQIQESSNGADMQAQRIAETVTAVEEMNATILEVTKNTVTTAQIAGTTRERAEEGESVVKEFIQSIGKVEKSTTTLNGIWMNSISMFRILIRLCLLFPTLPTKPTCLL